VIKAVFSASLGLLQSSVSLKSFWSADETFYSGFIDESSSKGQYLFEN